MLTKPRGRSKWLKRWPPQYGYSWPCSCCGTASVQQKMFIIGTAGMANTKPNVFAFDANGNLLWKYNSGLVGATRKKIDGIARDGSGHVYLSWWVNSSNFGIQQLDKNGNFIQNFSPSWTVGNWQSVNWWNAGDSGDLPNTLFYNPSDGHLYWQHVGRENPTGMAIFDCISKLAISASSNFVDVASYGASNFAPTWVSSPTTPKAPGRLIVDSAGNIWNVFANTTQAGTNANSELCKISNSGTLLFNEFTANPFAGNGNYATATIGGTHGSGSSAFAYAADKAVPLGYIGRPVQANFNFASNGTQGTPGTMNLCHHNGSGAVVGWCTGLFDDCAVQVANIPVNKCDNFLCINSNGLTNTSGQTPVFEQTWCTPSWPGGDQLAASATFVTASGCTYGAGAFVVGWNGVRVQRDVHYTACKPNYTAHRYANFGMYSIDAGVGTMNAIRSYTDIFNEQSAAVSATAQGLCYSSSMGLMGMAGVFQQPQSGFVSQRPSFFGMNPLSLSTTWRVDLSNYGALGLDVTEVDCTFADP